MTGYESLVGFGLEDSTDRVLERTHEALSLAPPALLSPLGWLAAVVRDLGAVAGCDGPENAFVEALISLTITASQAVDAHSLHAIPGQVADAETILGLAFQSLRVHAHDRDWHKGGPLVWIARLSEVVGVYASTLLASPDVVPTPTAPLVRLEAAGPAALDVAAVAMLAASVTIRDAT